MPKPKPPKPQGFREFVGRFFGDRYNEFNTAYGETVSDIFAFPFKVLFTPLTLAIDIAGSAPRGFGVPELVTKLSAASIFAVATLGTYDIALNLGRKVICQRDCVTCNGWQAMRCTMCRGCGRVHYQVKNYTLKSGEKATAAAVADAIFSNGAELVHIPSSSMDPQIPLPSKDCPICDGTGVMGCPECKDKLPFRISADGIMGLPRQAYSVLEKMDYPYEHIRHSMKDPSIAAFWLITFPQIMYGYNYDDNAKQTIWSEYKESRRYDQLRDEVAKRKPGWDLLQDALISIDPDRARDDPVVVKNIPYYKAKKALEEEVMKLVIMGDRGTGKSTTVRSLVDLLPEIKVVFGDPYNSDPEDPEVMGIEVRDRVIKGEQLSIVLTKINMVDLPLGATEDRVCGTIDIEKALTEGVKAFEPGLLAKANRGILYVDEVNLLDDHLVDVLLDSAASGWNTVEREGISISHPARFILIGSGNPEEGELRPQLLDRFGMHAQVGTVRDAELRVKIVEERARFDKNPKEFRETYKAEQAKLTEQITAARSLLSSVQIDQDLKVKISRVCAELNVDGLRGDIVSNRAAKALAALKGRDKVSTEDIATVIPNCLRHRLRKDPLESIDSGLLVTEKFYEVFS